MKMGLSGDLRESGDDDDGTSRPVGGNDVRATTCGSHDHDSASVTLDGSGHGRDRHSHCRIGGGRRILKLREIRSGMPSKSKRLHPKY